MSAGITRWLTLKDAAARVGKTERTIRNWVSWGELKPQMGRFSERELLAVEKAMRGRRGRPPKTKREN